MFASALICCLPLLAAPEITLPTGGAITLDGKIGEAEWSDAFVVREKYGDEHTVALRFKRTGPWLAVAVSGNWPYAGETLRIYTMDSERSWITALFFGIGEPSTPPLLWRRGAPGLFRERQLLPECPRACRARVDVASPKGWAAEYLVRFSVLGIGHGDRRSFFGLFTIAAPARTDRNLLTLPKGVSSLVDIDKYGVLVSNDRFGERETWPPITPDESREFDDHELLHRLYLEHDRIAANRPADALVISDAIRPRSEAKVAKLRGEIEAGRKRNPSLTAWDYYLGRLLHESNLYGDAAAVIDAIPEHLRVLDPFANLAAEHYLDTQQWDKAIATCEAYPNAPGVRDVRKAARRGKTVAAEELEARKNDATKPEKNPRIKITTSKGEIVCELFEDEAPFAVRNFVDLIEDKFFDRLRFHAVEGGSMAAVGDPRTRPGAVGDRDNPGWALRADKPKRAHLRGALATVFVQDGVYHGSQFVMAVAPFLTSSGARVTVFGRVVEGLEVLDRVEQDDRVEKIEILNKRNHAYDPLESRIR